MKALRTLVVSLAILAAGIAVLATITEGFHAYTTETARRIDVRAQPPVIPAVSLQTASGEHTNFSVFQGRWILVEFIYTRCMTYCSAQASGFVQLQSELAKLIALDKVVLLSISFDPARDNPTDLARYQRIHGNQGAGWIAVRPIDPTGLATLMHAFGVIAIPDGLGGFVHNAAIQVVNPEGRLIEILNWDDTSEAVRYLSQRLTP